MVLSLLFRGEAPTTPTPAAVKVGEGIDAGDDIAAFSLFCFMRFCALAIRPELMMMVVVLLLVDVNGFCQVSVSSCHCS